MSGAWAAAKLAVGVVGILGGLVSSCVGSMSETPPMTAYRPDPAAHHRAVQTYCTQETSEAEALAERMTSPELCRAVLIPAARRCYQAGVNAGMPGMEEWAQTTAQTIEVLCAR